MSKKPIATIQLNHGEVAFYDPITGIHLMLSKPRDTVYSDMNTSGIRNSIRSGRLIVLSGSIDPTPEEVAIDKLFNNKPAEKEEPAKEQTVIVEPELKATETSEKVTEQVNETSTEDNGTISETKAEAEVVPEPDQVAENGEVSVAPKRRTKKAAEKGSE